MKGIIIKGIGGFYYVKDSDSNIFECKARGIFRKNNIKPTVGDYVEIEGGSINEIYPRKSHLIRPNVANIDNLIIVIAAANPSPDYFLTDKLIVASLASGITPVICVNKTDLADYIYIKELYQNAGFEVIDVCAEKRQGTDEIKRIITGKVSAFAGLSGVGKSSILNLLGEELAQTGEISKINRGKHTTRHVELFDVGNNSYILDTPGFSSLDITDICDVKPEELASYFPEFSDEVAFNCRFKGCAHINEPDCSVKRRVERGLVSKERYNNYIELYNQLKAVKQW